MLCHFCGIDAGETLHHRTQQNCQHALEQALRRLRRTLLEERHARYVRRRRSREAVASQSRLRAGA